MDKKYSVFVSSTYEDLKEERQEVVNTLLQMDCFPIGMEYFNASDQTQWEMIKSLIDESDYYILIIAGRYGSVEPTSGKSYTQMEYEYARMKGVPTIAFIHEHPEDIPNKFTESEHVAELEQFKEEVQNHMVRYWNSALELSGHVSKSLHAAFKTHPRVGWMRADEKSSNEQNRELLRLKEEIDTLNAQIKKYEEQGPEGVEDLCQGEDTFVVEYKMGLSDKKYNCSLTWNEICSAVLPKMMQDCTEMQMRHAVCASIERKDNVSHVSVSELSFQTIKVQLLALGYIEEGTQPKTKKEYIGIWRLTKYGVNVMMRLNALRKAK